MAVIAVRPLVLVRLPPGSCRERLRRWVAAHTPFVLNERGPKLTPANSRMASVAAMPLTLTRRLSPAAHPHPHAGDRGDGRRAPGSGLREARYGNAAPPSSPIRRLSPGATAPRACRLRVGIPVTWPFADVLGLRRNGPPTGAAPNMDAAASRPARIPIRARAGAATEHGRRAPGRAAGSGLHEARYGTAQPECRRPAVDRAVVYGPGVLTSIHTIMPQRARLKDGLDPTTEM